MTDEDRLSELLLRWEDAFERGQELSPAELCHDCPELASLLAEQIESLKAMEWIKREPSDEPKRISEAAGGPTQLRTLMGRYRLDQLLGEGGFGEVWRGFDMELHRPVAVKTQKPGRSTDQKDVNAFLDEARKVARLKHPGIVPVHDVGQEGNCSFIVSELIEGGTLAERLGKGNLAHEEAARIVADAAEALDHAHRQGFVHRDLKPANILIDLQGRVYITDFGIAAASDEKPSEKTGTLAYMPPEQLAGAQQADVRGDIYSLGVVLYELLAGRLPFAAGSRADLRKKIMSRVPEPLRSIDRTIPEGLERACLKCLAKSPAARYSTARELATALRTSTKAKRSGVLGLGWIIGALTLVVVASILISLFFVQWIDEKGRPTELLPENWVQLFNGNDLTGWKVFPGKPTPWIVNDGILASTGEHGTSHLFSERGDYHDFHLRAEVRVNDGGNSGIIFRANFASHFMPGAFGGYEAQITSTPNDEWNKRVRTGSLIVNENEVLARVEEMLVPPDAWFRLEIIVEGKRITVKVNGETTASVEDRGIANKDGFLALQQWKGSKVQFRRIEIKNHRENHSLQRRRLPA